MKGKVKCVSNVDFSGYASDYLTVGDEYNAEFDGDWFDIIDEDGNILLSDSFNGNAHGKFVKVGGVIYIAGPMTGMPNYNREAFFKKAMELRRQGYVVLTPSVLPAGLSQHHYMDICLAMVRSSEAIYMLSGWDSSDGAVAEHALASKLALTIIYEE